MYEFLLILNLLVWFCTVIYFVQKPFSSAFHPASYYLTFHFIVFVFRPFFAWYREYDLIYRAYQFTPTMSDKIDVQISTMIGLIAFVFASCATGNAQPRFHDSPFNARERRNLVKPFMIIVAIIAPLGVITALQSWGFRAVDASTMVMDAATGHTINTTRTGYIDNLQIMIAPLAIMSIWLFNMKWWSFIPLLSFIILRGGTGGRWPLVIACLSAGLLILYRNKHRWPELRSLIIGGSGLSIFSMIGADRGASIRKLFIDDQSYTGTFGSDVSTLRFLEGMDFANLEYFEFLVFAIPQRTGTYGFFLDNLQLLTQPIPRVLWEEKPVGPPIQLFHLFDYGYPIGMTYSLPGNGWVQFGFIGVIIWCGLFGWIYGKLYNKFQNSTHSNYAILVYIIFLPLSIQFFRDGWLLTLVQTTAFFLLPVWLLFRFAKLAAVPLADELRLMAFRKIARRQPDVAAKILARRGVRPGVARPPRQGWPAE